MSTFETYIKNRRFQERAGRGALLRTDIGMANESEVIFKKLASKYPMLAQMEVMDRDRQLDSYGADGKKRDPDTEPFYFTKFTDSEKAQFLALREDIFNRAVLGAKLYPEDYDRFYNMLTSIRNLNLPPYVLLYKDWLYASLEDRNLMGAILMGVAARERNPLSEST